MDLKKILLMFKEGKISLEEAEKFIKLNYYENLEGILRLDVNRKFRTGIPEVVFGRGKELEDIIKATLKLAERNNIALATKIDNINELEKKIKEYDLKGYIVKINKKAKTLTIIKEGYKVKKIGKVAILTGGTADIPIAEEAKETLNILGVEAITFYDVGVAGIHRLFPALKIILEEKIPCAIVIAGMEGALPSVVASLIDIPIIAVPTSVNYGVKITPLLAMLHSCSPGVAVVNIDNGFGAATFAYLIVSVMNRWKHDKNP
ncbi:1-(5-phosphoribosyl)-5-amino-4-imidazole-carboxylate (AIR) carboxylase [Methanocaldococcus villosus KIN24-T80]|uniref:1-(5-phosphoribosyl)-5-amino-4-imidazole-carboxylate (AIR) carboxylase n=1 Tax=Methanocaldococcus villosus KIN24-T80 TaxID=1069083 RepID=N6UVI2_9EURY|nr:nickel pincer cofactor biosynthesis protein LarB [Methanocaldococcus villosus]ENN96359.1 1-(5-phosphoribosyl)-5-amino-4-imidazole-carboxylate (AIR) carboxylase [Methanocaldococcus villosus KIN24-T80]